MIWPFLSTLHPAITAAQSSNCLQRKAHVPLSWVDVFEKRKQALDHGDRGAKCQNTGCCCFHPARGRVEPSMLLLQKHPSKRMSNMAKLIKKRCTQNFPSLSRPVLVRSLELYDWRSLIPVTQPLLSAMLLQPELSHTDKITIPQNIFSTSL